MSQRLDQPGRKGEVVRMTGGLTLVLLVIGLACFTGLDSVAALRHLFSGAGLKEYVTAYGLEACLGAAAVVIGGVAFRQMARGHDRADGVDHTGKQ